MRSPNRPCTPQTTRSPGRTKLTTIASMPALPVPLSGQRHLVGGAEHLAQLGLGALHQLAEGGVEVADRRQAQRVQDAARDGGGAGAQQQALGNGGGHGVCISGKCSVRCSRRTPRIHVRSSCVATRKRASSSFCLVIGRSWIVQRHDQALVQELDLALPGVLAAGAADLGIRRPRLGRHRAAQLQHAQLGVRCTRSSAPSAARPRAAAGVCSSARRPLELRRARRPSAGRRGPASRSPGSSAASLRSEARAARCRS